MKPTRLLTAATLIVLIAAAPSFAQRSRGGGSGGGGGGGGGGRTASPRASAPVGRAVPRGSVHPGPYRNNYRGPYYRSYGPNHYYGYPRHYGYPYYGGYPYYYGYPPYYGYGPSFSFGIGFGYPYGYGYFGYPYYPGYVAVVPGRSYGGVRIDLPQRDAQVSIDGYFVGIVDNYDGNMQQLNLEPGTHRIEIGLEGFEPAAFNVNVEPGRTITYRTPLRPAP
jgi:hypothetical protein